MPKYKHSEAFAEIKAINEDIKVNLTSLQYLQILDYYIWSALELLIKISPEVFKVYVSKVIAYQQIHAMTKVSSEGRESLSCAFFNYVTTNDLSRAKELHLNRGLYFGIINYWLSKAKLYHDLKSPFHTATVKDGAVMRAIQVELGIADLRFFHAYYRQIKYWSDLAQEFKVKIMQKYTRMTIVQAQKTYVDFGCSVELDDVTQIYLQIMGKAIDRCDSRLGVLTTFIQSWLKSARAAVQKIALSKLPASSYEELVESGEHFESSAVDFSSDLETLEVVSVAARKIDKTGCLHIKYGIPQFISLQDKQILQSYAD